ncbi:MAG: chemotaxis-specific protein-glutamate methyltransferase CheB, partial [Planctomycetota bacterium]
MSGPGPRVLRRARVLVVDDQALYRAAICRSIEDAPTLEVVGRAASGREALERIHELAPDLVTLDMEMPDMDGLAVLTALAARSGPRPRVVVFSAQSAAAAAATVGALALGAADFVLKPTAAEGAAAISDRLIPRLVALAGIPGAPARPATPAQARPGLATVRRRIIAIASSTGGPNALDEAVRGFTAAPPVPVVIVQHMPALFTTSLAERLDRLGPLRVAEARDGMPLLPGHAYLAPGDWHLEVVDAGGTPTTRLHQGDRVFNLRPAADITFPSVVRVFGPAVVAAVFTGMGCDGAAGCRA